MTKLKDYTVIWSCNDNLDKVDIIEVLPGKLIIKADGSLTLELTKKLFKFFKDYSDSIDMKLYIAIDNSSIISINVDARLWLIGYAKDGSSILKANSYGNNIFIENTLLILINIISEDDDVYEQLENEAEALEWISNC